MVVAPDSRLMAHDLEATMKAFFRALYWEWLAWSHDPLARWFGRRELKKYTARLLEHARDPKVIEKAKALPPAYTYSRAQGLIAQYGGNATAAAVGLETGLTLEQLNELGGMP